MNQHPRVSRLITGAGAVGSAVLSAQTLRGWYNRHGASEDELAMAMPGDDLVPEPKLGYTRAMTINAPTADVWSWLVQIGQGRGGLYSYDWLENLAGCEIESATQLLSEHQQLEVGDLIRSGPDTHPCWAVMQVEPGAVLVLLGAGTPSEVEVPEPRVEIPGRGYAASTWQWQLRPRSNDTKTRLIVRQRLTYSPPQSVLWHVVEPINFAMEHKMLRGIKQRAEARTGRDRCAKEALAQIAAITPNSLELQRSQAPTAYI